MEVIYTLTLQRRVLAIDESLYEPSNIVFDSLYVFKNSLNK